MFFYILTTRWTGQDHSSTHHNFIKLFECSSLSHQPEHMHAEKVLFASTMGKNLYKKNVNATNIALC